METNVNGSSLQGAEGARKKERAFDLSLPVEVQGCDVSSRKFSEKTEISSLSSQEAVLWLRARLMIGTKLLLFLQVPRTLLLEKPLELCVSGTVNFVKSDVSVKSKSQLVSVKLDRNFQIQSLVS